MRDLVSLMKKINKTVDVMSGLSNSALFLGDKNMAKMSLELYDYFKKR